MLSKPEDPSHRSVWETPQCVLNLSGSTLDWIKTYLTQDGWKSTGIWILGTPQLLGMDMSISEKCHVSGKLPELLCLQQDFTTDPSVDLKDLLMGFGTVFARLTTMRLRPQWMLLQEELLALSSKLLSISHGMN